MSKRMFFYGTLCHLPLLEAVIGRGLGKDEVRDATLLNHAIYWVKDQIFPCIVEEPGASAEGIVFEASAEDAARLNYYEGGFNYNLRMLTPEGEDQPVEVYFPDPGHWEIGAPWRLADFVAQYAAITLEAATEVMRLYGKIDAAEASRRLPMLRAMATVTSRRIVQPTLSERTDFDLSDISLKNFRRAYQDFFALDEYEISHKRFDGGESGVLRRAAFISGDAVIVLPYDAKRDRVLLVEQFRVGPFSRGDLHPWMLEPIAGRIDAGESPIETAHREAEEEAGLTLTDLLPVSAHYPTPGASTEFFHCYLGLTDLPETGIGYGGLPGEGEDIRTHIIGFDAFMDLIESGEAEVGPLVLCGLWLARHRDRLRSSA
ncbi:NUDIX domain-containing protein [Aliiroseovarius sp. YM-037]|uniref:NUDIX domain-containing protein n=1 Tax=Aliiroseovarius sp. YM-037 TaxID=3341728 RepID=UPI003A80D955